MVDYHIIQQQLIMILLRSNILRFYHFLTPSLSKIPSFQHLEDILQKRLVQNVKENNDNKLKHYSFESQITEQLLVSSKTAEEISQRTMHLSIINPKNLEHQTYQVKLTQDLNQLNIDGFNYAFPFASNENSLVHFSAIKGVPTFQQLQDYTIDQKTLMIFNLPENVNQQDIKVTLKSKDVRIQFKYCILGLPAYAKVQFQDQEGLQNCMQKIPNQQIHFGERIAFIKLQQDMKNLSLGYRRLVVNLQADANLQKFIIQSSKYGRVLHINWPLDTYINPSVEEVKAFYKNSTELIRINQIFPDGSYESEYFPAIRAWNPDQIQEQQENFKERAEKLKESYENRARFAKNINVYIGRQNKIATSNKGYCVVTFSTFQQCQGYYFTNGDNQKIQLVGLKEQFQYDPNFKKQLLRQIDNEYLFGKKNQLKAKTQKQQKYINPLEEGFDKVQATQQQQNVRQSYFQNEQYDEETYELLQKLLNRVELSELLHKTKDDQTYFNKHLRHNNVLNEWENYLREFRQEKAKINKKSFDQLAEVELFGRVLPKNQNIEKLKIENTIFRDRRENELIRQNNLLTQKQDIFWKQKFYRRQKIRNNRIADEALGIKHQSYQELQKGLAKQMPEAVEAADSSDIGKKSFSTRKPAQFYRKMTVDEQADYKKRYYSFFRQTIYEYMGVFHDKLLQEAANYKSSIINPQSLRWANGTQYLTEQSLTTALQFRRDFSKAQREYENYIYGSQYIKSSGINVNYLNANYPDLYKSAIQQLTDVGVVQETKVVRGEDLQQKIKILNAQMAQFGEQYRLQTDKDQHILLKVRKLQHLLSIDRLSHLQDFISQYGNQEVTQQQSQIFDKYYEEMKTNAVIPDQVCDKFGVERGIRFNDLLAQVGSAYNINKKDLDMVQRAKTYSKSQLREDIDNQMKIQTERANKRSFNSDSFAKDPSQIYVKDRQGYYKVSRYRQI